MKQPKYQMGQAVKVVLETQHDKTKIKFNNVVEMYIVRIDLQANDRDTFYQYGLSVNLPAPYVSAFPTIFLPEQDIKL